LNQRAEKKITRRIITTHKDNPRYWDARAGDWTAEGYAYVVGKLQRLTGVRYQRFTLGKWVAAEGQVYESWNPQVHLLTAENPIREAAVERIKWGWTIGSVDWGWANPGVLHVYAVDGDGRMYLIAEHYMTHRSIEGWWIPKASALQQMYDVSVWACDPSEPQNIRAFQNAGMNAVAAVNDILPGISAVQERLAPTDGQIPRLYIFDECLQERDADLVEDKKPWSTVQEIPEYVWPMNTHGTIRKDRPVDMHNHGMDAMRYAVAEIDIRGSIGVIDDTLLAAWTDLPH
jgi:phage terminase large subunit